MFSKKSWLLMTCLLLSFQSACAVTPYNSIYDVFGIYSLNNTADVNISLQVRSCDDAACSGESFIGPDGTASSWFTTDFTNNAISWDLNAVSNNRYFQYTARFVSYDGNYSPKLFDTNTIYNSFPSDVNLDIGNNDVNEWSWPGGFASSTTVNDSNTSPAFSSALNTALAAGTGCGCTGCIYHDSNNYCSIPFTLTSLTAGKIAASSISIQYSIIPDANIVSIDGSNDTQPLMFSYTIDGNLTVRFYAYDAEADDLNFSMYHGASQGAKTTAIVEDLNLSSTICDSDINSVIGTYCEWDWNINSVADGNYFLTIEVNDGTSTDTNSTEFVGGILVDNTAPTTSWDGNHNNWQNTDANIHLTCNDGSGSGCSTTKYRLDTDSSTTCSYGSWTTYDANILISSDGNWCIDFNSTDATGNAGDVNGPYYTLIDKTPPSVSITSPGDGLSQTSTTVTLEYSGSDANSGITKYYVKVDADNWIDNNTNTSYEFTLQSVAQHTYSVKATDNADNNSSDTNITVTISSPPQESGGGHYIYCARTRGGTICASDENCSGSWVTANDTSRCCRGECIPTKTKIEVLTQEEERYHPKGIEVKKTIEEMGLQGIDKNRAIVFTQAMHLTRTIQVYEITKAGGGKSYTAQITIELKNGSGQKQTGLSVIERIPKEVAEYANEITTKHTLTIVEEDPVIEFLLPELKPNQPHSIDYNVNKQLSEEAIAKFSSPIIIKSLKPKQTILLSSMQNIVALKSEILTGLSAMELSHDENVVKQAIKINDLVHTQRATTVTRTDYNASIHYKTQISIVIENISSQEIRNLKIIEFIPEDMTKDLNQIKSEHKFKALEAEKAIEFNTTLLDPGQEIKLNYWLEKEITENTLDKMTSPLIMGELRTEEKPSEPPPTKTIPPKRNPAQTITMAIILLLAGTIIGHYLWRKSHKKQQKISTMQKEAFEIKNIEVKEKTFNVVVQARDKKQEETFAFDLKELPHTAAWKKKIKDTINSREKPKQKSD